MPAHVPEHWRRAREGRGRLLTHEDDPTAEEIDRVRRWECRQRGYCSWIAEMEMGSYVPAVFQCSDCGQTVKVVPT